MFTKRRLYFNSYTAQPKECNVGIPQGGVLSPLLFYLALREITRSLPQGVRMLQFADDILLCLRYEDLIEAQALMEEAVTRISVALGEMGFELALNKCQYINFSRKKTVSIIPGIRMGNTVITESPTILYLGIKLDPKLTWAQHIRMLEARATQAVGAMRGLAKVTFGAHPDSMLIALRGYVRAILEWGAIFIDGARTGLLESLNRVHYRGLRVALGCMRTTT